MRALHKKLWRELFHLRGQVLAIAFVMTGAIGTLVMSLSNYGALAGTRELYYAEFRFAEVFAQVRRAPLYLLDGIRAVDGIREAEARVVAAVNLEVEGFDEPVTGQIVSLPRPGEPGLNRLFLREGRVPATDDEVVLGEAFATAHGLREGHELVAILNGRRQVLRVSGVGLSPEFVYAIRAGDAFPDFERFGVLWMQRDPLAAAFDLEGAFNDLAVTLTRDARAADVIAELDTLLAPYGGVGAYDRELQLSHRFLDEELSGLLTMTRMFTSIFLVVAAFLLNVVVGRLVSSQREQIAVLKAFGYTRLEVSAHYAQLVLLIVAVGVGPGLAVGAWLGRGLSNIYLEFYSFPYLAWSLEPRVVLAALAFAATAGILGTASGLRRAFRLQPAEAMRPEAPPVFRRAISERLGLGAFLDPATRMVLRNLERRPMRSVLSVIGIGLGCAILVLSRYQAGAIEEMIGFQYVLAQRDDLSVTFVEPTSSSAAEELASLPGVRAVEPVRNAAVRLWNGHREYRTSLQGLPRGAELRRVLDEDRRVAELPADGLLLTDYLAEILAVRPGDVLDVEFLEGHRRTVPVHVAGTVREYLGVSAYAERSVVNRLLGEGGALTGAYLEVDPAATGEVLAALRERPRIASGADRDAMVQSFRDTMAENILAFAFVATLLAASIAVGVVYNAARLTLAERGRELASLRVLGYTRGEVRAILLDELGLLALLALLPGFALGYGMSALLSLGFRSDLYRIPLMFQPRGFALAALVILAATAVSGLLVRRRLDRLDLVAVLKTRE